MNKIGYAGLAAAAALALSACATSYGRSGLFGGYSEKQVEPGVWRITATTNGFSGQYSSMTMAIYRAAELARDAGFPYFQVVRSNFRVLPLVTQYTYSSSGGGEKARLRIRFSRNANPPLLCEMEDNSCKTYAVEEVLRELGPLINRRG